MISAEILTNLFWWTAGSFSINSNLGGWVLPIFQHNSTKSASIGKQERMFKPWAATGPRRASSWSGSHRQSGHKFSTPCQPGSSPEISIRTWSGWTWSCLRWPSPPTAPWCPDTSPWASWWRLEVPSSWAVVQARILKIVHGNSHRPIHFLPQILWVEKVSYIR